MRFPTSNWGSDFPFQPGNLCSIVNVIVHWLKDIWWHILITYPNTSIRTWWIRICSQFIHLSMPPPLSMARSFNSPCQSVPHLYLNLLSPISISWLQSSQSLQRFLSHLLASSFFLFQFKLTFPVHNSPPVICFHKVILLINYFYIMTSKFLSQSWRLSVALQIILFCLLIAHDWAKLEWFSYSHTWEHTLSLSDLAYTFSYAIESLSLFIYWKKKRNKTTQYYSQLFQFLYSPFFFTFIYAYIFSSL